MNRKVLLILLLLLLYGADGGVHAKSNHVRDLKLGDRVTIENILMDIFGDSIKSITLKNIMANANVFGGPCDIYGAIYVKDKDGKPAIVNEREGCFGSVNDFKIPVIGKSSILRAAWLTKSCYEIVKRDGAIQHALKKIGVREMNGAITSKEVEGAYALFYPMGGIGQRELEILLRNRNKSWRAILLSICLSFSWQEN